MRMIRSTVLLMAVIFLLGSCCCAQEWKNLTPLVSNCEDVKRIFNLKKCELPVTRIGRPQYRISIEFTSEDCVCNTHISEEGWNVPKGSVTNVFVSLYQGISIEDYASTLSNFVRKPVYDLPDSELYIDEKNGIRLTVTNKDAVQDINLFPSLENKKKFKCSSVKQ